MWVTAFTKLRDVLIAWSRDKCKSYICPFATPPATKIDRVVTYGQGTPPSKRHDLLITWSRVKCNTLYLYLCNIYGHKTWQSGNLWWGTNLQSHVTFWLRGHVANEKNLYLHFHNTCAYQTWQAGNLPSEYPT